VTVADHIGPRAGVARTVFNYGLEVLIPTHDKADSRVFPRRRWFDSMG